MQNNFDEQNKPVPENVLKNFLFADDSTPFDILFGVALPIACLIFVPYIFVGVCAHFAAYATFVYTAIVLEIMVSILWYIFYRQIEYGLGLISGIFFAGAVFAFVFGISIVGDLMSLGSVCKV